MFILVYALKMVCQVLLLGYYQAAYGSRSEDPTMIDAGNILTWELSLPKIGKSLPCKNQGRCSWCVYYYPDIDSNGVLGVQLCNAVPYFNIIRPHLISNLKSSLFSVSSLEDSLVQPWRCKGTPRRLHFDNFVVFRNYLVCMFTAFVPFINVLFLLFLKQKTGLLDGGLLIDFFRWYEAAAVIAPTS